MTPTGTCGIAWNRCVGGLVALRAEEEGARRTRALVYVPLRKDNV